MKRTTCEAFRTFLTMARSVQMHVRHLRHRLTDWPRLLIPARALGVQYAYAAPGWGYRRAGLDMRSDRDVDLAVFLIRNGSC